MQRASVAKEAEKGSHEVTMRQHGSRMLMRTCSAGGPKQGVAGGHQLGALVLTHVGGPDARIIVPEVAASTQDEGVSPVFQVAARAPAPSPSPAPSSSPSPSVALPPAWVYRAVCQGENPYKPGSWQDKHWSMKFNPDDGSLIRTWGSLGLLAKPTTHRLSLTFGAENAVAASHLAMQMCQKKQNPPPSKGLAYRQLRDDEALERPPPLGAQQAAEGCSVERSAIGEDEEGDGFVPDSDDDESVADDEEAGAKKRKHGDCGPSEAAL